METGNGSTQERCRPHPGALTILLTKDKTIWQKKYLIMICCKFEILPQLVSSRFRARHLPAVLLPTYKSYFKHFFGQKKLWATAEFLYGKKKFEHHHFLILLTWTKCCKGSTHFSQSSLFNATFNPPRKLLVKWVHQLCGDDWGWNNAWRVNNFLYTRDSLSYIHGRDSGEMECLERHLSTGFPYTLWWYKILINLKI